MWVKIRTILLIGYLILGAFSHYARVGIPPFREMPLIIKAFLSVAVAFGVLMIIPALVAVVGIQAINPWSPKVWRKPAWRESFLTFGDPIRFFHFVAFCTVAAGCGRFLPPLVGAGRLDLLGAAWLCGGAVVLLGVKLCMHVYKSKYDSGTPESQ